jgi:hypothetical protein
MFDQAGSSDVMPKDLKLYEVLYSRHLLVSTRQLGEDYLRVVNRCCGWISTSGQIKSIDMMYSRSRRRDIFSLTS